MPSGNFSSVLQCWRWRRTGPMVCGASPAKWVMRHCLIPLNLFNQYMNSICFTQIQKSHSDNNLHGWREHFAEENSREGPKHIQYCNRRKQCWFCVFNKTSLGWSWTLSTLHVARPEFGLNGAGSRGTAQISTRCFHRHDGLCIHHANIPLYRRVPSRLLHALSHHQHRYAEKGSESSLFTQQQQLSGQESVPNVD